jgi:group I intron endonuclease
VGYLLGDNMNSGIYQIKNIINGKTYIGQTQNFSTRKSMHFSELRGGYHHNQHLQNSFNKYGESNFIFEKLLELEDGMDEIETRMINAILPTFRYNIALIGGSSPMKGRKHTLESIAKMSPQKGKTFPKEINAKKGTKNNIHNSKLVPKQVTEIKKLLKEGKLYKRQIANVFDVNRATITDIAFGRTWVDII